MSDLHDEIRAAGAERRRIEELEGEVERLRTELANAQSKLERATTINSQNLITYYHQTMDMIKDMDDQKDTIDRLRIELAKTNG